MSAPIDPRADSDLERRTRWSRSARIQVILLVVNVAFWGAILGWTVTYGDDAYDPPDRLEDRAFPLAAEPICATTVDDIDELGLPTEVESPAERAELIDEENRLLRAMLDDLDGLPRPTGEPGEWVELWITDWRTHIADRQAWADDLRLGDDHPFTESDRAGEQVSKVIDNFAEINDMPNCVTTGDV